MSFLENQDIQFELSNPLYYPDDSAPPLPNISVSHMSDVGARHISATDIVSLVDSAMPRHSDRSPNAFMYYAGVPQTRNYSTDSGTVTTTGDHVFYSHLNVESSAPSHSVYDFDSLDTYFTELVPAMCGLHNISTHGIGIPLAYVHNAHHLNNSFAIQGVSNIPLPLNQYLRGDRDIKKTFTNTGFSNSQDMSRDYEALDFVFRIQRKSLWGQVGSNQISLYINSENQFMFRAFTDGTDTNGNTKYTLWGYQWQYDLSGEEKVTRDKGQIFYSSLSIEDEKLPPSSQYVYVVLRLDLNNADRPHWLTTDGNISRSWSSPTGFWPQFDSNRVSLGNIFAIGGVENNIVDADYNLPLSLQVIGYPSYDTMPDLLDLRHRIYPSPHEFAYPLYREHQDVQFPFVIPNYTGNMWEHVNKVATGLPYGRMIG